MPFTEGSRVLLKQKKVSGTIKYIGPVTFDIGEWIGVVLDEPVGRNNGTVKGSKYFQCPDNHGIFMRRAGLVLIENQDVEGSASTLAPVAENHDQEPSTTVSRAQSKRVTRPSMLSNRRSMSMPCIAVDQNDLPNPSQVVTSPTNDELLTIPPCDETTLQKHLYILYVQALAKKQLADTARDKKEQELKETRAEQEKKIAALKEKLGAIKKRIQEVQHIEQRSALVKEMEETIEGLKSKAEKVEAGKLDSLIELLKSANDELPVENIVLPRTDEEKQTCQQHLDETLKTLKEYVRLSNSSGVDISKLSNTILEYNKLSVEVKNSTEACSALEKELKDRVLEFNAKTIMLETRNRYRERKKNELGKKTKK